MQQKKHYMYLKNLKNLYLNFFKKHFNLYYFLFYFRSIDQKIKELEDFSQNLLTKNIIGLNILNFCLYTLLKRLPDYD